MIGKKQKEKVEQAIEEGREYEKYTFRDFDRDLVKVMINEPFFAGISRHINKMPASPSIPVPTAGVRCNPHSKRFELIYNPEFFSQLTEDERCGVLIHEFYHLILDHITTRKPDESLHKVWNHATDLAINSHIADKLPNGRVIPMFGEEPFHCLIPGQKPYEDFPKGKTSEWYFQKIMNDPDRVKKITEAGEGEGDGQLDDHSMWPTDMDEPSKQIARERMKKAIRQAASESAQSNSWGSVSADQRKEIMKRLKPTVDWRKVLSFFLNKTLKAERYTTQKRINRKYPHIHPGKASRRVAKVAISIDQSGSVSDDLLAKFFSELSGLAKLATFTVVPFDTEVDESLVFEWKKGQSYPYERVKKGGTCFDAPTNWVNDKGFDGHIILTDMGASKPVPSRCQRMWLTSENDADNPYYDPRPSEVMIPIPMGPQI